MQDQAVRLLTNLLGIYSPSGKEEDAANFLDIEMNRMGFEVGKDTSCTHFHKFELANIREILVFAFIGGTVHGNCILSSHGSSFAMAAMISSATCW